MSNRTYRFRLSPTMFSFVYDYALEFSADNPVTDAMINKLVALVPAVKEADRNRRRGLAYAPNVPVDLTPAEAGELAEVLPHYVPEGMEAPRGIVALQERLAVTSWKGKEA